MISTATTEAALGVPAALATAPNFVIAGAPKCGTTALYEYLRSHPQIFLTTPKEPHYFADDLLAHRTIRTLPEYERLFAPALPQNRALGEASVWYLHSEVAIPQLLAYRPQVKLIIMLRRPTEMLPSLHSDMCWVCFDDQPDFERAWRLQPEREAGRSIPHLCQTPWFLQYRRLGMLGLHVRRLLALVPRERVKFIIFDDLRNSPRAVYEDAMRFLEIDDDGRQSFPRVNAGKANRSVFFARLRAMVDQGLPRSVVRLGKKWGLGRLNETLGRLNSRSRPALLLAEPFRQELLSVFSSDIDDLGDAIGRDLGFWKT